MLDVWVKMGLSLGSFSNFIVKGKGKIIVGLYSDLHLSKVDLLLSSQPF